MTALYSTYPLLSRVANGGALKARPVASDPMTWKHLKRLAVCMALMVAAGFILLVSFSDKPNYSAYEPNDVGYSMHKSASGL